MANVEDKFHFRKRSTWMYLYSWRRLKGEKEVEVLFRFLWMTIREQIEQFNRNCL